MFARPVQGSGPARVLLRANRGVGLLRPAGSVWTSTPAVLLQHRSYFFKRKPKWENSKQTPDGAVLEEMERTARQLREHLAESTVAPSTLKTLILDFIEAADPSIVTRTYWQLLERALGLIPKKAAMSPAEIQKVYRAACGASEPLESLVTRLYSDLYNWRLQLPAEDSFENGILYVGFLRSSGLVEESRKLIRALLHGLDASQVNDKLLTQLLAVIQAEKPDVQSIMVLADAIVRNRIHTSLEPRWFHDLILAFTDVASKQTPVPVAEFTSFIDDLVLRDPKFAISDEAVIIILDCCLTLDASETGKRVLRTLARPRLSNLEDRESRLQYYELLLLACTRFGEYVETGADIVSRILSEFDEKDLVKETWDVLAQWAVYQSADEQTLHALLEQMSAKGNTPDETTLNEALSVAVGAGKRTDKYIEAIVAHFNELGIESSVKTYSILIDRKLKSCDVNTAQELFEESIRQGCEWSDGHLSTLDRLLVALCTTQPVDRANAINVYQRVLMFTKKVGYPAQLELLRALVSADAIHDVGVFISEQFGQRPSLPWQQYAEMYHALFDGVLGQKDYRLAWELYGYLNAFFKLPYESYLPAMQKFCAMGRPDASLLIFRYLRTRSRDEGIPPPNRDMYIALFNEFGSALFEEGVLALETLFRTDLYMEADVGLMNSILGAYCNLQDAARTDIAWQEVKSFPEGKGPDSETMTIMIKHFTRDSLPRVEQLWINMYKEHGLQPTADNLKQYIIANCYHGYYIRALDIAKRSETDYGIASSEDIIEQLYNWTMIESRKKQIEEWALTEHPEKWKALKERDALKTHLLPENPDNDSDESLRHQTIQMIEADIKGSDGTDVAANRQ